MTDSSAPAAPYTGCSHYQRKCQLECPTCLSFYPCRFCHDAEAFDGEKDLKLQHQLIRTAVKHVKCMSCLVIQPPSQTCTGCGTLMGAYFCGVCNLFDDQDKGQFHCVGCGICRVGGRDNFVHCEGCSMCIGSSVVDTHKCLAGSAKQNCSVCMEDIFTSRVPARPMRCGHYLHTSCLDEMRPNQGELFMRCPVCLKSLEDYTRLWHRYDLEVAQTPMPMELRAPIVIMCNDCLGESRVRWHVVGNKCASCGSYNTKKVRDLPMGEGAAEGGGGGGAEATHPSLHSPSMLASRALVSHLFASIPPFQLHFRPLRALLGRILGISGEEGGGAVAPTATTQGGVGGEEEEGEEGGEDGALDDEAAEEEEEEEEEAAAPEIDPATLLTIVSSLISSGESPHQIQQTLRLSNLL